MRSFAKIKPSRKFSNLQYYQLYYIGIDLKIQTLSFCQMHLHAPKNHENVFQSWCSFLRSIFSLLDIPYANNELNCLNLNHFKNSIKELS